MKLTLPKNLKLGFATAATQIEGGNADTNWHEAARLGMIKDGTSPQNANDHYARYKEDIDLMALLGAECYRFGVEWARIEPQEGVFDEDAIAHYVDEIRYVKSKGIVPILTLHHFSNPMWFERLGGWENDRSPELFFDFVKKFVPYIKDDVKEFITINEPNIYGVNCYFFGLWYPQKKSVKSVKNVFGNVVKAHVSCYEYLHEQIADALVGVASHLRVFMPSNPKSAWDKFSAKFAEKCFQKSITHAMMTGECKFPVKRKKGVKRGKYYDFVGINYYGTSRMSGLQDKVKDGVPLNDLGWEIYPEGIALLAKRCYEKYGAPIYITENGTCDKNDAFRSKFLYDHLEQLANCGVPVERYCHWTFADNFEWAEGEHAPFGMVALDFRTQERTVRPSGKFFADIIKNHGVTQEAFDKYVK